MRQILYRFASKGSVDIDPFGLNLQPKIESATLVHSPARRFRCLGRKLGLAGHPAAVKKRIYRWGERAAGDVVETLDAGDF